MRLPRISVRTLLALVLGLVLGLPVAMVSLTRLYENQLIRGTEELLIHEAVIVGESYRRLVQGDSARPLPALPDDAERFFPFPPALDIKTSPVLPRAERDETVVRTATQTGAELSPLLERVVVRTLSGPRVLDPQGVVLASSQPVTGYSLAHLPEVQAALRGRYAPVLRERHSEDRPPLGSISRTAEVRVSIAVPIYADPRARAGSGPPILGVVYNSRTPLEVSRSLWLVRRELYLPVILSVVLTLGLAVLFATVLSAPLFRLKRAAEEVARGQRTRPLVEDRFAPLEIAALSQAVEQMRRELSTRADYIREFAANAAHELKTPLTSLRGAAELLLEDEGAMDAEQRRRFLSNILSDALRMDQLVGRLLQLARIESRAPAKEPVDLAAFLAGTAERYRRRGAAVELELSLSDPRVELDLDQLDALLGNLVDNALRHGAGKPVSIAARREGAQVTLVVRDRGPRLPPEHFARVFERFYTTERARGGTGLGLAIVKAVAEAHGGSVRVEQGADGGASFVVELPASAP